MKLQPSLLMKAAFILVITLVLGCEGNEPTNRILMIDALYLHRMDRSGELALSIYKKEDRASALAALRVFTENLPDLSDFETIGEPWIIEQLFHYNITMRGRLAKVYYEMGDKQLGDEQIESVLSFAANNNGALWAEDMVDRESVLAFVKLLDDAQLP